MKLIGSSGLIKCSVLAPSRIRRPVLPVRINGQLIRGSCSKCMPTFPSTCSHTDKERTITGTWVIEEVNLAVEVCYRNDIRTVGVQDGKVRPSHEDGWYFYRVYELVHKNARRGWSRPDMSDEDKDRYLENVFVKEGVMLDKGKMIKNLKTYVHVFKQFMA